MLLEYTNFHMLPKNGSSVPPPNGGAGRRPLLLPLHKRAMLHEIRDSLSHLQQPQQPQQQEQAALSKELSQSTPNLAQKSSRLGYNQKALREIREDLRGLEISDGPATQNNFGFNGVNPHVSEDLVQKLMAMGYEEETKDSAE